MLRPGKIELTWDSGGQLHVSAPMNDKDLCIQMLAEALKAIAQHQAAVVPPDLAKAVARVNGRGS